MKKQNKKNSAALAVASETSASKAPEAHAQVVGDTPGLVLKSVAMANGATELEFQAGCNLARQLPDLVKSYVEFREAENAVRSRFFTLSDMLRKPVELPTTDGKGKLPAQKLNGREITLFLLAMGEIKQRATEFKAVAEMKDEDYNAVRTLALSKLETLKVARGTLAIERDASGNPVGVKDPVAALAAGAGDPATEAETGAAPGTATPRAPQFHRVAPDLIAAIHGLIDANPDAFKAQADGVPYEFKGATADGREYQFTLFVSALAVKPVNPGPDVAQVNSGEANQ